MSNPSPLLTAELLALPAPQSTRIIASSRAADVETAYERFAAGEPSGLHDLRVALRRLRSWLRAHREHLRDTVRGKTRRRLGKVANATNSARDAEVGLAWLAGQTGLTKRQRAGLLYVQERLERELEASVADAKQEVDDRLPRALQSLSGELATFVVRQRVDEPEPPPRMAVATRDVLLLHADALRSRLESIDSSADVKGVHRARIAVKRLRYLLEPLDDAGNARALVRQMEALQSVLGAIHDTHRVSHQLVQEIGAAAARDARGTALALVGGTQRTKGEDDAPSFASIRPGLTALAQRAHEEQQRAYKQFRRRWRKAQLERVVADVEAIARSLG